MPYCNLTPYPTICTNNDWHRNYHRNKTAILRHVSLGLFRNTNTWNDPFWALLVADGSETVYSVSEGLCWKDGNLRINTCNVWTIPTIHFQNRSKRTCPLLPAAAHPVFCSSCSIASFPGYSYGLQAEERIRSNQMNKWGGRSSFIAWQVSHYNRIGIGQKPCFSNLISHKWTKVKTLLH